MPVLREGNIWEVLPLVDLFLLPTHTAIQEKVLIPNTSILQDAEEKFPGLMKSFGSTIYNILYNENGRKTRIDYHLLISRHWPKAKIGGIQVQRNRNGGMVADVLEKSIYALSWWMRAHPETLVAIAQLDHELCESLDSRVILCN